MLSNVTIDALLERNHRILSFKAPKPRYTSALLNWINGNGSIARDETAYLTQSNDLLSLTYLEDNALVGLEIIVEKGLVRLQKCLGQVSIELPISHKGRNSK